MTNENKYKLIYKLKIIKKAFFFKHHKYSGNNVTDVESLSDVM